MNHRIVASTFILGVIAAAACIDMSAPSGPASISGIKLPSPSVILGDTMRDSVGNVAPLQVVAFDAGNNILEDATVEFFVTDSLPPAHLGDNNILIGDALGTVHLLGQVGSIQTPGLAVPVTRRPVKIVIGEILPLVAPLSGDTTQQGNSSIPVSVLSATDSASEGIIVRYTLLHIPESVDANRFPAVYLSGEDGVPSTVDTTDAAGNASRRVTVVTARLADSLLLTNARQDSAVVVVSVSYAGQQLSGSPDTVVVPISVGAVSSSSRRTRVSSQFGLAARFVRPTSVSTNVSTNVSLVAFTRSQRGSPWERAVAPGIRRRVH